MACTSLLSLLLLNSVYCSDQDPASGDDLPGPGEVTTVQYSFINNCTIMMADTGEKLNIAYTTSSLLVANPTDDITANVKIAKN